MTIALLTIILTSFILTWLVRIYAIRKSIIDIPNDRSSHTIPTPRGGGLAIAIAWFGGLVWWFCLGKIETSLFYALLCGVPLTLIGFADDVFGLKPFVRFIVQFACATFALYFLGGLNNFQFSIFNFQIPVILTVIAFIAIVWSINFFNFLDGIDGYLAAEIVFIGLATFLLINNIIGLILAAAVLGFLFWNWPKAKIFMGDVGSTLLGFTVAVMAIYYQNQHFSNIPVWLILTSVFWYDATITIWRRFRNKEQLSVAHRKHAFQRLVLSGWSHQKTMLAAVVLNIIGFGLAYLAYQFANFDWLFLIFDIGLLALVMNYIDKRNPFV